MHDDCKLKFLELKAKRTFRYIIFKIEEKQKEVIVEKVGEPTENHDDFAASLPDNECRYAVFDYDFVTAENCQKSRIFFIAWYHTYTYINLYVYNILKEILFLNLGRLTLQE